MNKVKNLLKVIFFTVLILVVTGMVSGFLKDKNNYAKYNEFYVEKENFDALFFGSSRMLDAIHPMQLWAECGITSYNMSQHSENLDITYWQMKNAFNNNVPKVAIVDISLFFTREILDSDSEAKSYLHKSMDHWKLSKMKYDALDDLLAEDVNKMEYLFPLTIYHYRWNELEAQDVHRATITQKGAETKTGILDYREDVVWKTDRTFEQLTGNAISTEILEKIIQLCDDKGIEIVFTYVPSISGTADESVCATINSFEQWFQKNDIAFLNLARDMEDINYATDFNDTSHVNFSGAKKITSYMGKYLTENYSFKTKRDSTVTEWQRDHQGWIQMKKEQFNQAENNQNLNQYLMLMNDTSYSYIINVPNISTIDLVGAEVFLDELGMTGYAESTNRYFGVKDGMSQMVAEFYDVQEVEFAITGGDIYFSAEEDGVYYNYCGIQNYAENEGYKIQIVVIDNQTQELIDQANFY